MCPVKVEKVCSTVTTANHYLVYNANLLDSRSQAIVNPVNIVGAHGKGLAKQLFRRFPEALTEYYHACRTKTLLVGTVLHGRLNDGRYMVYFPTKSHWRDPSQMDYITGGLLALKEWLIVNRISSIAIPAIGCGEGGLDWALVKPQILLLLQDIECQVFLYEPKGY